MKFRIQLVLWFALFSIVSLAQTNKNLSQSSNASLDACIRQYVENKRLHEYHKATDDRLILDGKDDRGAKQNFLNGGEYAVLGFFHCMNIQIEENYFFERGSFNTSVTFKNLS